MGKLLLQPHLKYGNQKATTTIINGVQNNQKILKIGAQKCDKNQQSYTDSYKGPIDWVEKSTAVEWQTLSDHLSQMVHIHIISDAQIDISCCLKQCNGSYFCCHLFCVIRIEPRALYFQASTQLHLQSLSLLLVWLVILFFDTGSFYMALHRP